MSPWRFAMVVVCVLGCVAGLGAQAASSGSISGTVTDAQGAVIPNAKIVITNKETGVPRETSSAANGSYSAVALPAGIYVVHVEAGGFGSRERAASVEVGTSTRVDFQMKVGSTKETVTVEAAGAQMNFESNTVQGVIQEQQIADLPLNMRNFEQLAKLEPGVTIATGTVAQFNVLFTVSVLGAGNRTSIAVDGGNVSDSIDVGGGMSSMNFSTETVQEFQLQSVNFDISTGVTAGGAINVVTKSGSNTVHGSGFFYYRDHNMAAYPYLQRLNGIPGGTNPFFARRNPGFSLGGPLMKDKLFFFTSYEYTNQVQAVSVQSTDPAFVNLAGTYGSPYHQDLFSLRLDYHINDKNNVFLRYSHDGNAGFGQSLEFGDPSNWAHNTNWADQSIIGWTSSLTPNIINDAHFQFNYWNNHNNPAVTSDCSAPCVANTITQANGTSVAMPNVFTFVGSNFPAMGPNFNAPQGRNSRRYEVTDALSWQLHNHRLKFGGDSNRIISAGEWGFCTPLCTGAFSPSYIKAVGASALFPGMPSVLTSDAQVLNLPDLNIGSSIFSGVGVGNPSTPAPYDQSQHEGQSQYRLFVQDVWKVRPNFTINYGFAWNAQVGLFNGDLPKPAMLAPILGTDLQPTGNNTKEFQPAFGFAWSPGKNAKWVIRGGGGIYWDSSPGYYYLREAPVIGPLLDGRYTLAASAFVNDATLEGQLAPFGLLNIGAGLAPVPIGAPLPLGALTNMTVGEFEALVTRQLPAITAPLGNPPRSGSIAGLETGIQYFKQGVEIFPPDFPFARSYQTSIGVQHDFGHGIVMTADWARRQGENVALGEVDLNDFTRYQGSTTPVPVIPLCTGTGATGALSAANPNAVCSTGSITFWQDAGRAVYNGLLLKATKSSKRWSFVASYAYAHATDENVWNNINYNAGVGQYLAHNDLNIAGTVQLGWGFSLSLNSTVISATPGTPQVSGLILPGTVPSGTSEPLPGIPYGSLNAGTGMSQLAAAVNSYNSSLVGTKNAEGAIIGTAAGCSVPTATGCLALPSHYSLGDPTISQDFRLTKTFTYKERYKLAVFTEMFNAFNISNLTGYSSTIDTAASVAAGTAAFGQPTARAGQTFGSGGTRALQVGARISF
jgi:hypothetical protein